MEAPGILASIRLEDDRVIFERGRLNARSRRVPRTFAVSLDQVVGVELTKKWLRLVVVDAPPAPKAEQDPYAIAFVPRKHAEAMGEIAEAIRSLARGQQLQAPTPDDPLDAPPSADSEELTSTTSEAAVEAVATPAQPPTSPRPSRLPWWYRWSYRLSMASYTLALAMYGLGCLLFVAIVVAAVLILLF